MEGWILMYKGLWEKMEWSSKSKFQGILKRIRGNFRKYEMKDNEIQHTLQSLSEPFYFFIRYGIL